MSKIAFGIALALGFLISAPAITHAADGRSGGHGVGHGGGVHGGVNVGGHAGGHVGGHGGGIHGGVNVGGGNHPTHPGPAVNHNHNRTNVGVGVRIGGGYHPGYRPGYRSGYYPGYRGVGVGVGIGINVGPGVYIGVPYRNQNPGRYVNVWVNETIVNYTVDYNGNYVPIYRSQRRLVTAFWDNVLGGYWYYNNNGVYTRAQ